MAVVFILLALSSLALSGIIFTHRRLSTLVATAAVFFEAQWMGLSYLDRTLFAGINNNLVFLYGSILLLGISLFFVRRWKFVQKQSGYFIVSELAVAAAIGLTLLAAAVVAAVNGFQADGSWLMHGFYNGDTLTFAALVERSAGAPGHVAENPLAGNGYLEYPSVLHGAVSTLLTETGLLDAWQAYLPIMTYLQIMFTVPLFFLLFDLAWPEPNNLSEKWFGVSWRPAIFVVQALMIFWVMTLSWDSYIYPQSHFFLTAFFLLEIALLHNASKVAGYRQLLVLIPAYTVALLLMVSNAVTGAAAIAGVGAIHLAAAADKKRGVKERVAFVAGIAVIALIYFVGSAGDATFGLPQFSYSAAGDLLRLGVIIVLVAAAILMQLGQFPLLQTMSAAMFGLGFVTFFFSSREIIVANASRFFYHGLLTAYPLILPVVIRIYYWVRLQLLHSSRSWLEYVVGWSMAASAVLLVIMPSLLSVASAHDNLQRQDEQRLSGSMQEAMGAIEAAAPDYSAIVLADPSMARFIPFFTGRSILRTPDYWLSPQDETVTTINDAFNGDLPSQQALAGQADLLLISRTNTEKWGDVRGEVLFENDEGLLIRLHSSAL